MCNISLQLFLQIVAFTVCALMENDVFNQNKVVIWSKQTVVHLLDSGVPWHSGGQTFTQ